MTKLFPEYHEQHCFFQSQDQKLTPHPQKTCQPIIVLSVKIVSIALPLSNKAISLTKFQSNCWVGQLTVIEMPAVPKSSMFVIEACCQFFFVRFSMYVNFVIGFPLTPHVPTPTRPPVESGDAKMLFFTLPLFVFEKTCQQNHSAKHYNIYE